MSKYKLVPVEPTSEMLAAGEYALEAGCYASGIYADMLASSPAVPVEPVGWQFFQDGKWWNGDDRIKDHKKNTQEAGFLVRNVYAALPPAEQQPCVTHLVEAMEQIERWDGFPSTDKTWEGSGEPVSYGAAFGSNGERDFMREVARKALAAHRNQGGE